MTSVMDAAMADQATIYGCSEGGSMALLFAATHPERTKGLITWSTFVRAAGRLDEGVPFIAVPELIDMWSKLLEENWGSGSDVMGGPISGSPESRSLARRQQMTASPAMARATAEQNAKIDIRSILPSVRVPTLVMHRAGEWAIRPEHGRFIAARIEGARYLDLPGEKHFPWEDDMDRAITETQEFVTGVRPEAFVDRVLATVMITDLVESTTHAARMADPSWRHLIERHNRTVRTAVERARGNYLRSTGDGGIATFDGPSRAVRCAKDVIDELDQIGLECRVGLHAGEIELMDDNIAGVAVHIAERVSKVAGAKEVVVSSTVRDLAVGSGIHFHDLGEHDLKGVPERWRLYRAKIA
jgi:class 3 adenylate cyclase